VFINTAGNGLLHYNRKTY